MKARFLFRFRDNRTPGPERSGKRETHRPGRHECRNTPCKHIGHGDIDIGLCSLCLRGVPGEAAGVNVEEGGKGGGGKGLEVAQHELHEWNRCAK